MSELTEDRVREIVLEELDKRKAATRARLNDQLAAWRADRARAAEAPAAAEYQVGDPRTDAMARRNAEFIAMVTPKADREADARRDDSTDRDGRRPDDESTT